MNLSYLTRLREQIAETKKKADPPLPSDALIILRVTRTPGFSKGGWETQVSDVFQDEGWTRGGVDPPSLAFILNEEGHFYFRRPQNSMNALISTASSICTKVDTDSPVLYQCTASHLTNVAEVLAYFVLETDHVLRSQAETLIGTPLDHMTEKEFWETITHSQTPYCSEQGIFYKLRKSDNSRLKGWTCLTNEENPIVKISTPLSFDAFEENISLLFNRS